MTRHSQGPEAKPINLGKWSQKIDIISRPIEKSGCGFTEVVDSSKSGWISVSNKKGPKSITVSNVGEALWCFDSFACVYLYLVS
jgi:hypothetical protein